MSKEEDNVTDETLIENVNRIDNEIKYLLTQIKNEIFQLENEVHKNKSSNLNEIEHKISQVKIKCKEMEIQTDTIQNNNISRRWKPIIVSHNNKINDLETCMKYQPMDITDFDLQIKEINILSINIEIETEHFNNNKLWSYHKALNNKDTFVIIAYINDIHNNCNAYKNKYKLFNVIPICIIDTIYTYYSFYPIYNIINKIQLCTDKIKHLEDRALPYNGNKLVRKYRNKMAKCGECMKWIGIIGDEIDEIIANNLPTPSLSDSEIEELAIAYSGLENNHNQTVDLRATNLQYFVDDYYPLINNNHWNGFFYQLKSKWIAIKSEQFITSCYCFILLALIFMLSESIVRI
eukprot:498883_1